MSCNVKNERTNRRVLFTLLFFGSGLERLHTKGADGSRYQSICDLTEPSQPMMNDDVLTQIDHNTGNYVPYSFRIVCGFYICEQGL